MVKGNLLMSADLDDPRVLLEVAAKGKTYVEIGTRWGGSAIIAGMAGCEVHCIDDFIYPKPADATLSDADDVRANWAAVGLDPDKLILHEQLHPPWPKAIADMKFDIGNIDGLHTEEQCRLDWEGMREHVTKYVLFHDATRPELQIVFQEAADVKGWDIVQIHRKTEFGVLEHHE